MKLLLISCTILITLGAHAQRKHALTGRVTSSDGTPVAAANIRVLGTSRGTVANADGRYRLLLEEGTYTLVTSSLAFRPDTNSVVLTADSDLSIRLVPSDIIFPEVVVTSEDPAIEIIRRAIANKRKWMGRLTSYSFNAFTRQVLKRDTSIASITESFTKGYWRHGDTLREIATQKRQTENIKSEFNFASVGRIINFYEDEIRFVGYIFVGPTADDALDYYDYKLLHTKGSFGREIYEIRMTPRTRTVPLFEGTINIENNSYALMGVDVEPNQAFALPFVTQKSLRYRQQFGLYEKTYWMPADIRIDVSATVGAFGISLPPIGFSQTSVITEYEINTVIPDTIFQKPRLIVDSLSVATLDTLFWQRNSVLPLTKEETQAYATLDSTQTLEVQFRPRGFVVRLGGDDNGAAMSTVDALELYFNRVGGLHLGTYVELDSLSPYVVPRAGVGYGFSDKRMKYSAGLTFFASPGKKYGIGADFYRKTDHRPDAGYYGALYNSFTSITSRNDYRDYFEAEGWRAFVVLEPTEIVGAQIGFVREKHRSVAQRTDFSLFSKSRSYRTNPHVTDGNLRSVTLDLRIGEKAVPFDFVRVPSVEFSIEHSDPAFANSSFDFTRFNGKATFTVRTIGRSLLFPAQLAFRVSAGTSSGTLPAQRLFDLESASGPVAPFGVFKAMEVKEFSGSSYAAINAEHNFRSLPFLALGIPFLYENNIEFILHGGAGRTWLRNVSQSQVPLSRMNGWYGEVGFGFSRIFELLRTDFTWRLSSPGGFRFSISAAHLM